MRALILVGFCLALSFWLLGIYKPISPKEKYERIVALSPSFCETIASLKLEHLLVGVVSHCQGEKFDHVYKVGSFAEPSFEAILKTNPDLILAINHPMAKKIIEQLSKNIKIFSSEPNSLEDIYQITISLAKLLHIEERGEKLVEDMKRAFKKPDLIAEKTFLIALSASPLVVA